MLFEKILSERLQQNIVDSRRGEKVHKSSLDGLVKVLTRTLVYAENHKHFDNNGKLDGYHIMSSEIKLLARNKLAQEFKDDGPNEYPFFTRAERSTYHANNARFGSNGYAHWYTYGNVVQKSINEAYCLFSRAVGIYTKFSDSVEKYENSLNECLEKPVDLDVSKYLVVPKGKFEFIVNRFIEGVYEGAAILINRLEYSDEKYVYIKNKIEENDRLLGLGREYTTIGLLRKDVRKFLLKGYNEVDISTAAQSVFMNLYYDFDLDIKVMKEEFPIHYLLLTNKVKFREKIKYLFRNTTIDKDPAFSIDDAKRLITAMTYSPNTRFAYKYCVMRGFGAKRTKECKKFVDAFIDETKKIRAKVLNKYYENNKKVRELIDNDIADANSKLKGKGKGKSLDDRRMFRIYELYETKIRNTMFNYIDNKSTLNTYQIHDCIVYCADISVTDLRQTIYNKTSFVVKLELSGY